MRIYSAHSLMGLFSGRLHQVPKLYFNYNLPIVTRPVNFPVGGNLRTRRKLTTFFYTELLKLINNLRRKFKRNQYLISI